MLVKRPHYSRAKNIVVGILCGMISILLIYIGVSNMREYGDCLWGGLFLLLLSILCIVYTPKSKEECSDYQSQQYDSSDGEISMEDIEIKPNEEEYEYVEVKSYVRRKKK